MSKDFYDSLSDNFAKSDTNGNRNLIKRLKTVEIFIKYLEDQERKESFKNENSSELEVLDFNITKFINNQYINFDKPRIERALRN